MNKIQKLFDLCRKSNSNFWIVLVRYFYFKMQGKIIFAHQRTIIKGAKNISINGFLKIGLDQVGFIHKKDITYLNIQGKLDVLGGFAIGRGCRLDIGPKAVVTLGKGSFINPFCTLVIMHQLDIGEDCAIAWNCKFMDEDFHKLQYEGKQTIAQTGITIGDHVWIGSNVSLFKGVKIPKDSVVAANSVVKKAFEEEGVLIAGNPAKIIKRNVIW